MRKERESGRSPGWFVVTTDVFAAALEPLRREIDEALAACSLDDAASLEKFQ